MMFAEFTYDEYIERAKAFHGSAAPGILLGGYIVEYAKMNLDGVENFNVICESAHCLPDSVQLLTPCTTGNGRMKIADYGRFAVVFYDQQSGEGVRVYIDYEKLSQWQVVKEWFMRITTKQQQSLAELLKNISDAGDQILGCQKIKMCEVTKKGKLPPIVICQQCCEPFPQVNDEMICLACGQSLPYKVFQQSADKTI